MSPSCGVEIWAVALRFLLVVASWTSSTGTCGENQAFQLSPSCSTAGPFGNCRSQVAGVAAACAATPLCPCALTFAPGLYRWNTSLGPVTFADLAAGVTLNTTNSAPPVSRGIPSQGLLNTTAEFQTFGLKLHGLFSFRNVTGVTITGPFVVDSERPPFTYGQVTNVIEGAKNSLVVQFNSSIFPFQEQDFEVSPWLRSASHLYGAIDPILRVPKLPMYWGTTGNLSIDVENSVLHLSASSNFGTDFVGEWVVVEHFRDASPAYDFSSCVDVSIKDLSLYSHAGFGIMMVSSCTHACKVDCDATGDSMPHAWDFWFN